MHLYTLYSISCSIFLKAAVNTEAKGVGQDDTILTEVLCHTHLNLGLFWHHYKYYQLDNELLN